MTILNSLLDHNVWQDFLQSKKDGGHLSKADEKQLANFILQKRYIPVAQNILNEKEIPLPTVAQINKKDTGKKRLVFVFEQDFNMVLKLLAHLLYKYDYLFADNLYSFRKTIGVKKALADVMSKTKGGKKYSYKVDIHDYFNSVDTKQIITLLDKFVCDDKPLNLFLKGLLTQPYCIKDGQQIACKKGIMAGVPVSGFLANLFLKDMDDWFEQNNVAYARYSDDVIVFADTLHEIEQFESVIKNFLQQKGLEINSKKEVFATPDQKWEFLGFAIKDGQIDLSDMALQKIKDKMHRKAKKLVMWKKRTNASDERAISAFIRTFNKKFFDNPKNHEITWCRWYFPTITTEASLKLVDEYALSCIRYISTGKHTKANFNLRYDTIKQLGYKSLVNSFFKFKKTGNF
ncbi:MAG: hypothetical protein IKV34_00605 [Clostridia bacterium]|nr:hypothetical protein [Clostridia bacterium]